MNQKPSLLRMFSYNSLKFNYSVKKDEYEKLKNSESPNRTNTHFLSCYLHTLPCREPVKAWWNFT